MKKQKSHGKRKLAVITGASCGIGYELAKVFGEHGYDLLICSSSDKIFDAKNNLEETGAKVDAHRIDLSLPHGAEELFKHISSLGTKLDAIAINAGVGVGGDFARQTKLEDEVHLINLNVVSTVKVAKLATKLMLEQGEGKILFTSSIAATMPGPYEAVYAASKAFIQSFALAIRNELSDTKITVTSLMPGPTDTDFFHRANMEDTRVGRSDKDDPATVAKEGYEALMSGSDHIVAGSIMNKVQAVAAKVIPDIISANFHRQMAKPQNSIHH